MKSRRNRPTGRPAKALLIGESGAIVIEISAATVTVIATIAETVGLTRSQAVAAILETISDAVKRDDAEKFWITAFDYPDPATAARAAEWLHKKHSELPETDLWVCDAKGPRCVTFRNPYHKPALKRER
jgi:hypothetical protein